MRFPYRGAGIGLILDGRILLGKRTDRPFKGQWCVPGGGREKPDASELSTAAREFAEETGVDFSSLEAKPIGSWKLRLPFFRWCTFFYSISDFKASFSLDEFSEVEWVPLDEVGKKMHLRPFTKSEVRCLIDLLRSQQA